MSAIKKRKRTLAGVVVSNLTLCLGIFLLDWDPRLLLILYWFEAGIILLRETTQGLFAQQPSSVGNKPLRFFPLEPLIDKRGRFQVVSCLPPIYPRNVPYMVTTALGGLLFWTVSGLLLVGVLTPTGVFVPAWSQVLVAFVIVGRHALTFIEAVRSRDFESETATSTVSRTVILGLLVLSVISPVVVELVAESPAGAMITGVGLIILKVCYDGLEFSHPGGVRSVLFDPVQHGETAIVEVPTGDPIAEFETETRGVLVEAVVMGVVLSFFPPTVLAVFVVGVIAWLASGSLLVGVAGVAAVVSLRVIVEIVTNWLLVGNVVYRIYPEAVVAYDTLLSSPQWSVPRERISDAEAADGVVRSRLPSWFGKVRIDRYDGESRRLHHVRDANGMVDILDGSATVTSYGVS